MDEGGPQGNRRHRVDSRMDYYKWNMVPQYQAKEQSAYHMHTKISMLYGERDTALEERDRALSEKAAALEARDLAIQQRDEAITDRDNALRERDNAMAALQFQESTMNALLSSGARGLKRTNPSTQHRSANIQSMLGLEGECITEAFPVSVVAPEVSQSNQVTKTKVKKNVMPTSIKSSRKVKKLGEDLNRHVTTDGSKAEWDAQDFGSLDQIQFDESTMPVPVCSCTGVHRQCYKWGSGGWQSSCCTTSLSVYPLPQMPNKKHARMGGRKMSGSVFSRLLTRLATAGHDLSIPVDLKNNWAKHGTNRYITIK